MCWADSREPTAAPVCIRHNKRIGHCKGRFRAEEKRESGKGIVNGFLAGAEVKSTERKSYSQLQVIKLPIGVSSFFPFSAYCLLGARTDRLTDRQKELQRARVFRLLSSIQS